MYSRHITWPSLSVLLFYQMFSIFGYFLMLSYHVACGIKSKVLFCIVHIVISFLVAIPSVTDKNTCMSKADCIACYMEVYQQSCFLLSESCDYKDYFTMKRCSTNINETGTHIICRGLNEVCDGKEIYNKTHTCTCKLGFKRNSRKECVPGIYIL